MGHLSRKPSNNVIPVKEEDNPWGTEDDTFNLLSRTAIRCCHCNRVVSKEFVVMSNGLEHAFCPDCKDKSCRFPNSQNRHFNIHAFLKESGLQ